MVKEICELLFILICKYIYMYAFARTDGMWQINQLIKNMIGINLGAPFARSICKRFSMLLECFRKCSTSFTPNQTTRPGGGSDDQRLCLEACVTLEVLF